MVEKQLSVLKKCRSDFDCLNILMVFIIKELNFELNTHKKKKLYSRQTLYLTLRANTLLFAYYHFVTRVS